MVIYEVNLTVAQEIYVDFIDWLKPHIEQMLSFEGFVQARCLQEQRFDETSVQKLTVQYMLRDWQSIDNYLNNHAAAMRDEGLQHFPNQFTATRRFFEELDM